MPIVNSKDKVIVLRIIFCILILANMALIFYFSADDGESSGRKSRMIVEFIAKIVNQEENEDFIKAGEHVIRKLAHFTIYASLGVWTMLELNTFSYSSKKKIIISILIGLLYAITDEIHQGFSPRKVSTS